MLLFLGAHLVTITQTITVSTTRQPQNTTFNRRLDISQIDPDRQRRLIPYINFYVPNSASELQGTAAQPIPTGNYDYNSNNKNAASLAPSIAQQPLVS